MNELHDLIAENRALHAELRVHVAARRAFANSFRSSLTRCRASAVGVDEVRVVQMTSLLLEAHQIALRDEEGLTIDLLTDALAHLDRRLAHEVLSKWA